MENVVAELRERLERRRIGPAGSDSPEARLRQACSHGSGHLVVTGSDRAEIHTLLTRVLDTVEPLRAVRTLAVDSDPNATFDRVISALDADIEADTYLDRRDAMLALLARAEEVDKSIFVVVDDADHATIEQLEQVRASLDVIPEAFDRLRLVLVGDESLTRKLAGPSAESLRERITTSVALDDADGAVASPASRIKRSMSHAWTLAVMGAVAFFAATYSLYATGLSVGGSKDLPTAVAASARPSRAAMYAIRGDELFLDSTLRIAAVSAPTKTVVAPPPARATTSAAPLAKPRLNTPATTAVAASTARVTTRPSQPAKIADTKPAPGSSIDAFLQRFPTAR